jgi:phage terminase Nu1 subunit (DNA packaging protein)
MLQHNTDLSDLLGPESPAPAPHYQRAAEGPSPVQATPAARKRAKPASDQMTIAEPIPATMTEAQLAAFLGIATSQVRTKTRDGVLIRVPGGKKGAPAGWDVRASLRGYLSQLREGAVKGGPQTDELKAEKLRLAREQADKLEIANAAARGDMVRAADVEREWANVLRDVRSTMLAVPSRVGSKLAHLSAHDVAEIDSEIKAALEGLANGN